MADQKNTLAKSKEERKIPLFTVLKNNVILKNIYLIIIKTHHHHHHQEEEEEDLEETLLVGRHPDCDIRLEHPSISRFHLRIHSKPNSNYFTVTDLSSVHGTWVSGRRIEPRLRTEMNEGDTLRIGGSTRIYRLHWIPLAQAYDFENPFMPPLDLPEQEEEKDDEIRKNEAWEEIENEDMQSVYDDPEPSEVSLPRQNSDVPNVIPLSLSEPEEDITPSSSDQENGELESKSESVASVDSAEMESLFLGMTDECFLVNDILTAPPEDTKAVVLDEGRQGGEIDLQFEDELLVDSALDGLELLFLNDNSAWLVQEAEDVVPKYEVIQSRVSALESLGSMVVPDMGSQWFVGNETLTENNEETYREEQAIDEENSTSCSVQGIFLENEEEVAPEQQLFSFEESSNMEISYLSSDQKVVDAVTCVEGVGAAAAAAVDILEKDENKHTADTDEPPIDPWSFWSASLAAAATLKLSPPISGVLLEAEKYCIQRGSRDMLHHGTVSSEMKCLNSPDIFSVNKSSMKKESEKKEIWSFWSNISVAEAMCSSSSLSDGEVLSESDNEQMNNKSTSLVSSIAVEKAGETSLLESFPTTPANKSNLRSIWSRRGNADSGGIQIQTSSSRTQGVQKRTNEGKPKYKPITKGLSSDHDELFTPDKENYTPNTQTSMRQAASLLKEVPQSNSTKSSLSKTSSSINIRSGKGISTSSDKENQTPKALLGQKSATCISRSRGKLVAKTNMGRRLPFQCLLVEDSPQKSVSQTCVPSSAVQSRNSAQSNKEFAGEGSRRWNMVVDITCLLNKESRNALQLLEGLKGTRLVIPRIVIRELDCMKRKSTFFRRKTEVSAALEWIEECLEKREWWMHIQTSVEEGRSVAPTPPPHSAATPQSVSSSGRLNGSAFGILPEIVSPTAEDHVLDYALFFRRFKNDGHLVLLTNDIALRIKAMGEGLICETAEEFRESLVNPFSERFLWADSSPRGQTWSFLDDIALRQNFYPSSLKLPCKADNMKGLKLILVNDFQHSRSIRSIR
ncbi:hypothetical protein Dimus_006776 [Dionaea muscipula]